MRLSIDDGSSSSSPMDHSHGHRRSSLVSSEPVIIASQVHDTQPNQVTGAIGAQADVLREQEASGRRRRMPMRRPASTALDDINPKRLRLEELDETATPHPDTDVIPPHLHNIHSNLQAAKLENHPSPQIRQLAKKFTPLQLASLVARRKLLLVEAVMRHSAGCKDLKCRQVGCKRMKACYGHLISCRASHQPMQSSSPCHSCKQLLYLLAFHAKRCQQQKGSCPVPYCSHLRKRMTVLLAQGKSNP